MSSLNDLKVKSAKLPPIDESVHIPAAIRAASMRASELHSSAYQPEEPGNVEEQPVAGEVQPDVVKQQKEAKAIEKETPAGKEAAPAASEDYEHKYNSIKGRYDQQENIIRGQNARISQLESLLAAANARPLQSEQPPSELKFGKLTEKDREDFGEEFLDAAARAAEEKMGPHISKLEGMVRQLGGSVENVAASTAKNAQNAMYEFLNEKLPEWRTINRDPKFIAWTNLPDPLSGAIRVDMMRDAHAKSDGSRVLNFFRGFLQDEAASDPASKVKPEMPAEKANGKVPLSEFAAPGRAKAPAATHVPGEKETISHAQISQFYLDVQKGKYKGNEAEKDRLEREIFAAQAEGRVT